MRTSLLIAITVISFSGAAAQTDSGETFKSGVTVIQVPVTVRDRDGNVVSNLGKDDFQLFDNGKRQEIVSFSVETPGSQAAPDRSLPDANAPRSAETKGMEMPGRFVAYFFDDRSIREIGDLTRVRNAAAEQFAALQPGDRAAIFTSSCQGAIDFTNDRPKLQEAVSRLGLHPTPVCRVPPPQKIQLELLKALVHKMANLPARRDIVLISPGFFVGADRASEQAALIDAAVHSKVSISTIDMMESTGYDSQDPEYAQAYRGMNPTNPEVLVELAHGTGGTYVSGSDYALSFRKLSTPESHYLLGFIPTAQADGSFHKLKVKLDNSRKLSVEARSGYVASKSAE